MEIGFIGLGVMGLPMALNLLKAGTRLRVWNRSPSALALAQAAGARVAADASEVFDQTTLVILMLANDSAMDEVLGRGTPAFASRAAGRTVVSMGTFSPGYSLQLETDIRACGGRYIEAPVSGSRKPAEAGQLVGMLAGDAQAVQEARPWLAPMCSNTFVCGAVPSALRMKLAVNVFLITMVTGLGEAAHFARELGLDMAAFRAILDAGPMASAVSRIKLAKLVDQDFGVQASIADVLKNTQLVADAAREGHVASPLIDACLALYADTARLGHGSLDMAAVVKAMEARTTQERAGG
ncbi:NAD(P)-dependent oxidoreductase [Sphaerotilaceae bacterium SBD11-9]